MKKRLFFLLTAIIVTLSALFSGCSCSGDDTLTFSNILKDFTTETLSYKVEYVSDYNESTAKTPSLDNYFTFEYSIGTFNSEYKKASKSDEKIKNSDILEIKNANGEALVDEVYSLTTDFEIDLKVTLAGNEYTHKEKITTETYIAPSGVSFAPLYAKEDAEYFIITINSAKAEISVLKSVSETFYNKNEYRTIKTTKSFKPDETVSMDGAETTETTTKYSFRSAIDNAELLFAVRGLKTEEKSSEKIKAVSSGFNSPQPLKISNLSSAEKTLELNYNGSTVTENIKYSSLSFSIDNTRTSGAPQYLSVQTEAAGNVKNTCLLLEYVKPLVVYGDAFTSMGALKFTLNGVTVS